MAAGRRSPHGLLYRSHPRPQDLRGAGLDQRFRRSGGGGHAAAGTLSGPVLVPDLVVHLPGAGRPAARRFRGIPYCGSTVPAQGTAPGEPGQPAHARTAARAGQGRTDFAYGWPDRGGQSALFRRTTCTAVVRGGRGSGADQRDHAGYRSLQAIQRQRRSPGRRRLPAQGRLRARIGRGTRRRPGGQVRRRGVRRIASRHRSKRGSGGRRPDSFGHRRSANPPSRQRRGAGGDDQPRRGERAHRAHRQSGRAYRTRRPRPIPRQARGTQPDRGGSGREPGTVGTTLSGREWAIGQVSGKSAGQRARTWRCDFSAAGSVETADPEIAAERRDLDLDAGRSGFHRQAFARAATRSDLAAERAGDAAGKRLGVDAYTGTVGQIEFDLTAVAADIEPRAFGRSNTRHDVAGYRFDGQFGNRAAVDADVAADRFELDPAARAGGFDVAADRLDPVDFGRASFGADLAADGARVQPLGRDVDQFQVAADRFRVYRPAFEFTQPQVAADGLDIQFAATRHQQLQIGRSLVQVPSGIALFHLESYRPVVGPAVDHEFLDVVAQGAGQQPFFGVVADDLEITGDAAELDTPVWRRRPRLVYRFRRRCRGRDEQTSDQNRLENPGCLH